MEPQRVVGPHQRRPGRATRRVSNLRAASFSSVSNSAIGRRTPGESFVATASSREAGMYFRMMSSDFGTLSAAGSVCIDRITAAANIAARVPVLCSRCVMSSLPFGVAWFAQEAKQVMHLLERESD